MRYKLDTAVTPEDSKLNRREAQHTAPSIAAACSPTPSDAAERLGQSDSTDDL